MTNDNLLYTDQFKRIESEFDIVERTFLNCTFTGKDAIGFDVTTKTETGITNGIPQPHKKNIACTVFPYRGENGEHKIEFYRMDENGKTDFSYKMLTTSELFEAIDLHLRQLEFVAHGTYYISNSGGYEVELSPDGETARVRDCWGGENPKVSDWLPIDTILDEDWDGEEESEGFQQVIDPDGYNIPLSQVTRVNR